jgi:hypothetical protein
MGDLRQKCTSLCHELTAARPQNPPCRQQEKNPELMGGKKVRMCRGLHGSLNPPAPSNMPQFSPPPLQSSVLCSLQHAESQALVHRKRPCLAPTLPFGILLWPHHPPLDQRSLES